MKLRIHGNSLRFRLNRTDIEILDRTGLCEEQVRFGSGSRLVYALEASSVTAIESEFSGGAIRVRVPLQMARTWTTSSQIALVTDRAGSDGPSLLIEKDFECLHRDERTEQDDANAFPNPKASTAHRD